MVMRRQRANGILIGCCLRTMHHLNLYVCTRTNKNRHQILRLIGRQTRKDYDNYEGVNVDKDMYLEAIKHFVKQNPTKQKEYQKATVYPKTEIMKQTVQEFYKTRNTNIGLNGFMSLQNFKGISKTQVERNKLKRKCLYINHISYKFD